MFKTALDSRVVAADLAKAGFPKGPTSTMFGSRKISVSIMEFIHVTSKSTASYS